MIHDGDVPSVQREMNLMWSKSMREVDGPNFIFIDFNVPALSPRHGSTETSLQLSENLTLSAIRGIHTSVIAKMAT
jgi:hypothetical protein